MKTKKYFFSLVLVSLALVFTACEPEDIDSEKKPDPIPEATALFVLSEGSWNGNNSTLANYTLSDATLVKDFFFSANNRALGELANDMGVYGSKLYVVVNGSATVEVVNVKTGVSLAQIAMVDENRVSRQPRRIDFYKGKAYVCSYDGTVAKIDTASLKIEGYVTCGTNPDGLCVANGKLYVSNSGGLNYADGYDNTVSVVDLESFTEIKKITVDVNPGKLMTDSEGDVYVATMGNYGDIPSKLHRISSATDELIESFNDVRVGKFSIHDDKAYIYNYDNTFKVFDCKTERIVSENFITDGTVIQAGYGIDINRSNGDVYVTDAKNYTVLGDVLCFDKEGKLKFKIEEVGLNPNKVVFY
ncbi:MAG TPA: YncE family protein [Paludibacter sp.]|nr:MAG: hypothetical protein BWY08_00423 [Bacteroidetes bacterium ADurb.Bin174]HQB28464.1 YncE family protein [Paludibacter sp.]